MAIQRILAMTEAEIRNLSAPPSAFALLGCHFSPEKSCLVGLPDSLPSGCGLVIDDRNAIFDLGAIEALKKLEPAYVILDFQRPPEDSSVQTAAVLAQSLRRVIIPPPYADALDCPLFLPPVPPHTPISEYLKPWQGREIWLELALDASEITVTPKGTEICCFHHAMPSDDSHRDSMLHCHYKISQRTDALQFYCYRTQEDIEAMLRTPLPPNLTHAVGLFYELGSQ